MGSAKSSSSKENTRQSCTYAKLDELHYNGRYYDTLPSCAQLGFNDSFTVCVWLKPDYSRLKVKCLQDLGILGAGKPEVKNKYLHLTLRAQRAFLSFYGNDVTGSAIVIGNRW